MEENMIVVDEIDETTEDCEVTETGKTKSKAPLIVLGAVAVAGIGIALRHKIKEKITAHRIKKLTKQGYVVIPREEDLKIEDSGSETEN